MDYPTIRKSTDSVTLTANLRDYESERRSFSWAESWKELFGETDPEDVNIAKLALDRNIGRGNANKIALKWIGRGEQRVGWTYAELLAQACRFANVLAELGTQRGDRVFSLIGRQPDLYAAALGTWRAGAVFCPLFSAFGPEPARARMSSGDARVVVTTPTLYRRKIAPIRDQLPTLKTILLVGDDVEENATEGLYDLRKRMATSKTEFAPVNTDREELAILHFTSGTTGKPKGAMHVHAAALHHYVSARYALDLKEDDIFWCTADPGWVTGTTYGLIAPLLCGCTLISDSEEFDAERWYRIIDEENVTVWYTAPTAVRMMMKYGTQLTEIHDLSSLRYLSSVGEPLNPEAVLWGQEAFGLPFHDNWWQSETGAIMISNYAAMDIKPGSMGRPLPGIEIAISKKTDHGNEIVTGSAGEGELALKTGWPSLFRGYLNEEAKYQKCFEGEWYLTGDLVKIDEDGYVWFVGRADDVIKSAGHLIGPFEVESALIEHEAVAEAGVIGIPDPIAMEVIKAFVSLNPGHSPSETLVRDLMAHARKRLGPAVAPRHIEIVENLPKTRSGKVMRRLLKARELGLPEGDTSTLESSS